MIVAGVVSVGAALLASDTAQSPVGIGRLLLTITVVAISDTAVLHLRFGRENYTLTWSEAALLVGLTVTPWPWITIASPLGIIIAQAAARRSPVKIAFNAASIAVGSTVATGCIELVAGSDGLRGAVSLRFDAALVVSALVFFLWNSVTVAAVIAAARKLSVAVVMREGLALKLGLLAGNTVLALLLVNVPWRGSAVVLIPFSIGLLYIAYRGYHRATEESDVWRQLDAATKELTSLDISGVATAAVLRAVTLFNADFAELALSHDSLNTARVFRCDSDGSTSVRNDQPDDPMPAMPAGSSGSATGQRIVDTVLSVPASSSEAIIGVLRLGLRDPAAMPERQQRVLRTFAHGVAASLQNARLYGAIRHQADLNALEAARDPLTGIANRKVLHSQAETELERAALRGSTVGLLLIDLDHFKEINDTLGHHAGDAVLCAIAERLTVATSSDGLVARLGGDEFAILLNNLACPAAAETVARNVMAVISEPVLFEGLRLAVGGSIGIACYPDDGATAEDLLRRADMAMYQAKQARGAISRYRSDRDDHSVGRITLAGELRNAIRDRQFLMQFQPQVDLVTGLVVGAEALARWRHPTRGVLAPLEFIDLVEQCGLSREFAVTTLEQAVREAARWHRRGLHIAVSVNLSARNLLDVGLPADVSEILHKYGLPAEYLVLEITETTMITDAEAVEAVLSSLRHIGAQLSVDDFGTGYSSLAFLQRVAVNELKIDKSFVIGMTKSDNDSAIVRATVELAHGLGIRVVAEGVETADHVAALIALGCDVAQGWHFGRPGSADQILESARSMLGSPRVANLRVVGDARSR